VRARWAGGGSRGSRSDSIWPDSILRNSAVWSRVPAFDRSRYTGYGTPMPLICYGESASECRGDASIAITVDTYSRVIPGLQEDAALRIDSALRAPSR
jgi:hypothetical protein